MQRSSQLIFNSPIMVLSFLYHNECNVHRNGFLFFLLVTAVLEITCLSYLCLVSLTSKWGTEGCAWKLNRMDSWNLSQAKLEICCWIEVCAMVLAVRQPSATCTAIFTMFIAIHSAVTIHKTCTDQQWNGLQTVPASEIKGQSAGNTPNTLILAHRPRSYFL